MQKCLTMFQHSNVGPCCYFWNPWGQAADTRVFMAMWAGVELDTKKSQWKEFVRGRSDKMLSV